MWKFSVFIEDTATDEWGPHAGNSFGAFGLFLPNGFCLLGLLPKVRDGLVGLIVFNFFYRALE